MSEKTQHLVFPITGMTCANCVATVERNIKKLDGVRTASVNLASERASVEFDPSTVDQEKIVERIQRVGYGIATGEADLLLQRLSDDSDARRLERALLTLDGVTEANASLATERDRVSYIPTVVSQAEIRRSIKEAGFEALESTGQIEDVEREAREREIRRQRNLLIFGLTFTVPLFLLSMLGDLGIVPEAVTRTDWYRWLMFTLATPVQFYVGRQYYDGAFKALRNRSANMDVLIAMGSSAAYFYSLPVLFK